MINKKEAGSSVILRTISDPTSVANLKASNAATPPRPPPARKVLESLSLGESPDTRVEYSVEIFYQFDDCLLIFSAFLIKKSWL